MIQIYGFLQGYNSSANTPAISLGNVCVFFLYRADKFRFQKIRKEKNCRLGFSRTAAVFNSLSVKLSRKTRVNLYSELSVYIFFFLLKELFLFFSLGFNINHSFFLNPGFRLPNFEKSMTNSKAEDGDNRGTHNLD